MVLKAILFLVALSGCESSPVDGAWVSRLNDGCEIDLDLNSVVGTYSSRVVCDGLAEVETGTLAVTVDGMDFVPEVTSCPAHPHDPWSVDVKLARHAMTISNDLGPLHYRRGDGKPWSVTGCWDMGAFTPAPLV